ncbi:MAG: fibronectin type III domain-containing protein [Thermoplasmata archaeon]
MRKASGVTVKGMSRTRLAIVAVLWLLSGSIPAPVLPQKGELENSPYLDESFGRFDWVHPYPTGADLSAAAWTPDGKTALIAGAQGNLILYDGTEFLPLYTNTTISFTDVAWHPGGYALITATGGKLLRYSGGSLTEIPTGTTESLLGIDINQRTGLALVVGERRTVLLVEGEGVTTLSSGGSLVLRSVSWEPGGVYALVAGDDPSSSSGGRVLIYSSQNKTLRTVDTELTSSQVIDVAFSPTASVALISTTYVSSQGSLRGRLLYWNGTGLRVADEGLPPFGIAGVSWRPDGAFGYLLMYGEIRKYTQDGAFTSSIAHRSSLNRMAWRPDGSAALVVGEEGYVGIYDELSLEELSRRTITETLFSVAWSPDGTLALAVGAGGLVAVYDGNGWDISLVRVKTTRPSFYDVAWKPDGSSALIVGEAGSLVRYSRNGNIEPNLQSGTVQTLRAVAWSPSGDYALIVGDSGTIRRFDGTKSIPVPSETTYTLRDVAFNPSDGDAYIVGGDVREVMGPTGWVRTSWQVMLRCSGMMVSVLNRVVQQGPVFNSISFSPALIACDNGELRLIEENGEWRSYTLPLASNLLAVSWLPDTGDALVVGEGGTAALFNESRRETRLLPAATVQPLTGLSSRPRGEPTLCSGWNGMVLRYTSNTPPTPVTLHEPTNITDNALELSWTMNPDKDFSRYEVYQSTLSNFSAPKLLMWTGDRSRTGLLVTGLARLTTYYFMVRVLDRAGLSADSNVVRATTLLGNVPPAAVTLYAPTSVTDSSMTLSWSRNNDGDFARYELHGSTQPGFTPSQSTLIASIPDQNTTQFSVTGLLPSTNYYFRVRTWDTGGLFNDSNRVNATTAAQNLPPEAPVLYPPSNITESSMTLSWSRNNDSDFARYTLFMGNGSGFEPSNESLIATIENQSTTSYTASGLSSNTTYFFRLRVEDTGGLWNLSGEVNGTTLPPNAPPSPVALQPPTDVTETSMRLEWSESPEPDFKQYELHASTTPNFNITAGTAVATIVERDRTNWEVGRLLPETTYYFKVRVRDTGELYADSNEVSGTTLSNRPPPAVVLYKPFNETERSMQLEWTASEAPDFARYELHCSKVQGFTPEPGTLRAQIFEKERVVQTVSDLEANTTYYFRLRVYDTGQLFNDSNEVSGTTLGPDLPPVAPVLADPIEITESSVLLEWTQTRDPDFAEYIVHRGSYAGFAPSDATKVASIPHASTTTYNVTGLKPNTVHYFRIEVRDLTGHVNYSNEVRAKTLTVNIPPIADAGQDMTVTAGERAYFWAYATDPDGYVTTYEWDFQGDGVWDYRGINGNTSFVYETIGFYQATLRVTDDRGGQSQATVNVTVEPPLPPNIPPVILYAGEAVEGYIGEEIPFSGTAIDPDGYIVKYEWDFDGDGVFDFESATDANTTAVYSEKGSYTAVLRVTDNRRATAYAERGVEILRYNNPPEARIDAPRDRQSFYVDELVTLDGRSSYDPDGDRMSYLWENVREGKTLGTSALIKTTFSKGNYTIRLTVSDGELSASAEVSISVQERPNQRPTVKIEQPLNNSIVKGTVTISGTAKDDKKVEKVEVKLDPTGAWQKASGTRFWSYELDTRNLAAGIHTVYARAYDGQDYSQEVLVKINVQNPVPKREGGSAFVPGFGVGAALLCLSILLPAALAARRRQFHGR